MNIGSFEILVIILLALMLYGRRLPEITRAMGKGYKSFKKEVDGVKQELTKIGKEEISGKTPEINPYSATDTVIHPENKPEEGK
ncbi:MAG: twin-arginine translocase TatA/TatE family subunit [Candidatus Brocadiia bacterium]